MWIYSDFSVMNKRCPILLMSFLTRAYLASTVCTMLDSLKRMQQPANETHDTNCHVHACQYCDYTWWSYTRQGQARLVNTQSLWTSFGENMKLKRIFFVPTYAFKAFLALHPSFFIVHWPYLDSIYERSVCDHCTETICMLLLIRNPNKISFFPGL